MRSLRSKLLYLSTIFFSVLIAGLIYYTFPGTDKALSAEELNLTEMATIYTSYPCSGRCESGAECNVYGSPEPGYMWSCWNYSCVQNPINEGGSSCYLDCQTGWGPCGCDVAACESTCLSKIGPGQSGTYTMGCANCGQLFTCSCSKPQEILIPCGDPRVCTSDAQCEDWTNKGILQNCYSSGDCVDISTTERLDVECDEKLDPTKNRCALTSNACPAGYTAFTEVRDGIGVCGCRKLIVITTPPVTTPPVTTPPVTTPPVTTPPVTTPPVTTPPVTTPPVTTPPVTTPPVTTPPVTTPPVTTPPVTTLVVTTPPGLPKTDTLDEGAAIWLVPLTGAGSFLGVAVVTYQTWKKYGIV